MTASDVDQGAGGDHDRSLAERVLDLLVYAPAGVVMTVLDDFPELATRGRARLEQELRNSEIVGRFAVQMGLRELRRQVKSLAGDRGGPRDAAPATQPAATGAAPRAPRTAPATTAPPAAPATPAATAPPAAPATSAATTPPATTASPRPRGRPGTRPATAGGAGRDLAVDRAIPDYDTLSASQVVRRLDGLSTEELGEVMRHELATRGRRTIVHRAEQLLAPPGPGAPTTA